MVATLYKKKPTFNIESVNTDYSSDLPPYFLGIKNAIYVQPQAKQDEDKDNELDKYYKERIAEADEEDDFVEEEYQKRKRLDKAHALQQKVNLQTLLLLAKDTADPHALLGKAIGKFLKEKVKAKH